MKLRDQKIINGKLTVTYETGEKGDRRLVVMVVDQRNIALFKSLMLSEQRRDLLKSLCLASGVGLLLLFGWFWQAWIIDNFSPTGLYRHMPHPYDVWICLFIEVFWLALGTILIFLVTCYPFVCGARLPILPPMAIVPLSQSEKETQC